MRPSEVRRTILDDHAALRARLAELRDGLHALAREEGRHSGRRRHLRELADDLQRRFRRHVELEERALIPALREADAWGEERAARVEREHAEQRQRLDALLERLGDPAERPGPLAAELESLVADLLADMEHEDRSVLSERVLRDDVISLGEPE